MQVDNRTTLSIGEIQMQGACGIMDPEVPPLWVCVDPLLLGYPLARCGSGRREVLVEEHVWQAPVRQRFGLQDPTCAKVSISGRMGVVAGDALPEAERLLFQRHPQMRGWPVGVLMPQPSRCPKLI